MIASLFLKVRCWICLLIRMMVALLFKVIFKKIQELIVPHFSIIYGVHMFPGVTAYTLPLYLFIFLFSLKWMKICFKYNNP